MSDPRNLGTSAVKVAVIGGIFTVIGALIAAHSHDVINVLGGQSPVVTDPSGVGGGVSNPATSTPSPAPASDTRAAAGIVLNFGQTLDLDSTDLSWGKSDERLQASDLQFWTSGATGQLRTTSSASAAVVDGAPSVASCREPQRGSVISPIDTSVSTGKSFCFQTNQHRYAWITLKSSTEKPASITLDVLVWTTPFN